MPAPQPEVPNAVSVLWTFWMFLPEGHPTGRIAPDQSHPFRRKNVSAPTAIATIAPTAMK
jgi:hypothetical protein